MSVFLQPIYTRTLTGAAYTITFNSIPQTFTDLVIKISSRTDYSTAFDGGTVIYFNGDNASTNYSSTEIQGSGSSAISQRFSSNPYAYVGVNDSAGNTANTFGSFEFYIPNYTGSNYKSFTADLVAENNATTGYQNLTAGLWRSTSAITSLSFYGGSGNYNTNSTFSLYGVLRNGI